MNSTFKAISRDEARHAPHRECNGSQAFPSRTVVHAKLEMTEPGDQDELEADAVANDVVNEGKIARKISGGGGLSGIAVPQQMESRLAQLRGGGRPMPQGLQSMMESGFGREFPQVRLHTDSEAASLSASIGAKAFTQGNDIYFNREQFNPDTIEGRRLMAHELTHVVQGTGKLGREEVIEDEELKKAGEYLNKTFIHREDRTITSNSTRKHDVIYKEDGKYKEYEDKDKDGNKRTRGIIDCEVFALELISELEKNSNSVIRRTLANHYPNRFRYTPKLNNQRIVTGFKFELLSVDNTSTEIQVPKEIFDPDNSPEIKYRSKDYKKLKQQLDDFGHAFLDKAKTSPILSGNNKYYPIQFVDETGEYQRHTALLFKRNNVWYLSNNNIIEKLEVQEDGDNPTDEEVPRKISNQAIQQTLNIEWMPNYTVFYFNGEKY